MPVWADASWLIDQGVRQWTEMPLWRTRPGTWMVDASRANSAGLVCRPFHETMADFQTALESRRSYPIPASQATAWPPTARPSSSRPGTRVDLLVG